MLITTLLLKGQPRSLRGQRLGVFAFVNASLGANSLAGRMLSRGQQGLFDSL